MTNRLNLTEEELSVIGVKSGKTVRKNENGIVICCVTGEPISDEEVSKALELLERN